MSNRRGHSFNNYSRISFRLRAVSNREFNHKDPSIINIPRPNFNIVIKRGMDVDLSFRDFSCDENPLLKKSRYSFFEDFNFSKEGEMGIPSHVAVLAKDPNAECASQALAGRIPETKYTIINAQHATFQALAMEGMISSEAGYASSDFFKARNQVSRFLRFSTAEDVFIFADHIKKRILDADADFQFKVHKFLMSCTKDKKLATFISVHVFGQEGGPCQDCAKGVTLSSPHSDKLADSILIYSAKDQAQAVFLAKHGMCKEEVT